MRRDALLVAKAVTWRLVGTIDTFIVSWIVTGKPEVALSISGIEFFTKILLYYAHERAWLPFLRKI